MAGILSLTDYLLHELLWGLSTAILSVTYRISSELRSQATAGLVSTTVGDHVGIRGAVGSLFFFLDFFVHVFSCGEESREKPEGDPRLPLRLQSGANTCKRPVKQMVLRVFGAGTNTGRCVSFSMVLLRPADWC